MEGNMDKPVNMSKLNLNILEELPVSDLDLPPFEFYDDDDDDDDEEEDGECSSDDSISNCFDETATSSTTKKPVEIEVGKARREVINVSDVKNEDGKCVLDDPISNCFDKTAISSSPTKKAVEVLIEIGKYRKIVINVGDVKDLESAFFKAVAEDTALEEFIDKDVIFQRFDYKFNTWVNLNRSFQLCDGTHLKAIFRKKRELKRSSSHRKSHSHKHKKTKQRRQSSFVSKYRSDEHRKSRKRSSNSFDGGDKHRKSRKRSRSNSFDGGNKHRKSRKRSSNSFDGGDKHRKSRKRSRSNSFDGGDKHRKSRKINRRKSFDGEGEKCLKRSHSKSCSESDKYGMHRKRSRSPPDDESDKYHKSRTRRSLSSDDERGIVSTTTPECYSLSSYQRPHYIGYNYVYSSYTNLFADQSNTSNVKELEWEDEDDNYVDSEPITKGEMCRLVREIAVKNPVSALHELCSKLKWRVPKFEIHSEKLNPTDPQFLMKVTVKGQTYIPQTVSRKKKAAKTVAAVFCLKKLGVLKEDEEEEDEGAKEKNEKEAIAL